MTNSLPKRVWILCSDKGGDNAQIEIVMQRLGWRTNPAFQVETRKLIFKPRYQFGKPPFFASLYHVDQNRSDALKPPWPDLILTVGRRPAMAALWVKKQSEKASPGAGSRLSRIVLFGRPKRWMRAFDLIIAPVQYQLPPNHNLLTIGLPLMRVDSEAVAKARAEWQAEFAELGHPLVAVMVGGSTKPYVLNRQSTRNLIEAAVKALPEGGTLYFSTSRRTPQEAIETLKQCLPPDARLYEWKAGGEKNPYLALMGSADEIIVTGDSVSMMTEAVRLQRRLLIFPLPKGQPSWLDNANLLLRSSGEIPTRRLEKLAVKLGLVSYARNLEAIHQWLYRHRLAAPLGEQAPLPEAFADDDLERVAARLNQMVSTED